MKSFALSLIALLTFSVSGKSFYSLDVKRYDGKKISMSSFRGKKIIITAFARSTHDDGYLKYLSSFQLQKYSNLIIIAVPATDFSEETPNSKQLITKESLPENIILTESMKVNKRSVTDQAPLFQWLTKAEENTHFDVDVLRDDQLFFISESGTLYAILDKSAGTGVIEKVLQRPDIKE